MSNAYVLSNPFPLTGNEVIDVTTNGYKWHFPVGTPKVLNWSVSSSLWSHPILQSTETQADFTTVFGNIQEFIDVKFNFLGYISGANGLTGYENAYLRGSDLNITYAYNGTNSSGVKISDTKFTSNSQTAFCYFPDLDYNIKYLGAAGDTFLNYNNTFLANATFEIGTNTFTLLLHEVLHGLGLKHPHDSGGTGRPTYTGLGIKNADRQWISVMSYDRHENGGDGAYTGSQPIGPMLLDAIALQYLYGESTFNSGNTTYDLNRYLGNYYNCQWDASGTDLLDAGNLTYGVVIELDGGQASNGVNLHHIGFVTTVLDYLALALVNPDKWTWLWGEYENVNGTIYDDIVSGNDLANVINGGDGDDYLAGGSGDDTFDWDSSLRGGNDTFAGGLGDDIYVIDSPGDSIIENPSEGIDTIFVGFNYSIASLAIENLITFSGQTAPLAFTGNYWSNILESGAGNDRLSGGAGNDTLKGGAGDDTLDGGEGDDTALFTGLSVEYHIMVTDKATTSLSISSRTEGTDKLSGIEYLKFSDRTISASAYSNQTSPTVAITSNRTSLKAGETATIGFALSNASTDFIAADVTVTGGTLSNFLGSGSSYTAIFTPTANSSAKSVVSIGSGRFSDNAGNFNADGAEANNTLTLMVDTILPIVALSSSKTSLKAGEAAAITFTLSETSTDFTAADVTVTGGTLSSFAGSGTSYTATFTPAPSSTGNGVVSVVSGKFSDAAGNFNADGADANNTVTLVISTLVIQTATSGADSLTGSSGSDTIDGLEGNDTIHGAAANDSLSGSGGADSLYGDDGDDTLAGGTGNDQLFGGKGSDTATFSGAYSANTVTALYEGKNGALSGYRVVGPEGTDTLSTDIEFLSFGSARYELKAGSVIPLTPPPKIAITSNKASVNVGETATISFALSAPSTDFTASDLTVSGGTITSFAGSGTGYTATFTPMANASGNGTVSVASGKFSDAAGNFNTDGAEANNSVTMSIISTRTSTLTVLVDKGVLGTEQVLLKNLVEEVTTMGTTVTAHTLNYLSNKFNYKDVDALITTVIRDGNFTEEFRKEISDQYPTVGNISYSDAVSLVGSANIDAVLISVAGADGNYVG